MLRNEKKTGVSSPGYELSLRDGNQWHLKADAPLSVWMDKFAAIMELKTCPFNNKPKLTFSIKTAASPAKYCPKIHDTPLHNAWYIHDLKILCVWFHKYVPDTICKIDHMEEPELEIINMWRALYPIYRESIRRGGLPFHAALVEKKGSAVLLAGPGDTGKSTCCRRLPDDWKPLCDDETLVVLDNEKRFRAHPFPTWSDYLLRRPEKTWDVQYSVPLGGVFFLEQSDTDETIALGRGKAAALMIESVAQVYTKYWRKANKAIQRKLRGQLFDNACRLANRIPAFTLRASLNGRFWEKIEQALGW